MDAQKPKMTKSFNQFFNPRDLKPDSTIVDTPPKIDPKTGMHPEYGKNADRYKKLDPISARAMPKTGDPEIDVEVAKAAKKPKTKRIEENIYIYSDKSLSNWRSEIETPNQKLVEKKNLFHEYSRIIRQIELEEALANSTSGVLSGGQSIAGAGDVDLKVVQTGLTGDGGIDYGDDGWSSSGSGNSTHTGVGEYTGITNLEPTTTAPDPTNVGTGLRVVDFFDGLQTSSIDLHMKNLPGYRGSTGTMSHIGRNIAVSGRGYTSGSDLGKHRNDYGYTVDELGKTAPVFDNDNGLTDKGYGSALVFKSKGHWGAFAPVDTSEMDTIKLRARIHQDSIVNASFSVQLYYWAGDKPGFQSLAIDDPVSDGESSKPNDGWRPIYQKPDGTIDDTVSHIIIPDRTQRPAENHNVLSDYAQQIPEWCRGKDTRFLLFSKGTNVGGSASFALTSVRFQRRNAITIGAPLDSPEASSFVRVGQGSADTTPEQRKKRVEEMLKASRLYMLKLLGYNDFPGMGATLDKVAASPTSFTDVWNIHAKSLGNKERQSFRRAVSDRGQDYSYRSSSKNYSYKVTSKDSKGLTRTATARTPESVAEYERRQRWRSQNRGK